MGNHREGTILSPLDGDQLERKAVRPLACRRVRGPPCDTFLAPVVASRRYSQQVTFIGAEFRRYLWIRTLAP